MKRWLSVICLGTLSLYTYAAHKELVSSSIKAVTVYADRAAINRQAEVSLPAGEYELYFKDLPVEMDNNSVQVNVLSTNPTTVLDVTTKQRARLSEVNPRLQKIDDQIQQLNDQKNKLADQAELLANQYAFIETMQAGVFVVNKDGSRPSVQELKNVMQFSKENLLVLLEKQRQINAEVTKINEQLANLQNERQPIVRGNKQAKDVVVRVNLQQPSQVNIDLSYVTPNALWYPRYDVRFDTKNDQLQLDYSGIVQQRTGEDWKNVKLTLSTAKPNLGSNLPKLKPWLIDQAREVVGADLEFNNEMADMKMAAPAAMVLDDKEEVQALRPMASVDMGTTSASFTIENPISLNSGSSEQRVSITALELPHKLNYITVPKLASVAYLQVEASNNSDFPLIAGKLNVFMDNRFVASSHLKATMPKEILKLDLGADEGISVTYKPIKRFTEKTGFTNSYDKVTYEYLLTVQNNKKTPQNIKVFDQIPVSENESITVKQLSPDSKLVKQDQEGKINWELNLNPQEKKEISIRFSIEYPNEMPVVGVN